MVGGGLFYNDPREIARRDIYRASKKRLAIKLANSELKLQQGDLTIRASFSNILRLIFLVNDVLFFKLQSGSLLSKWTFFFAK